MQDKLTSWKEIAAFFGRSVRTVQRWHVTQDLPVRKLQIGKKAYIYAEPSELQAWLDRNAERLEADCLKEASSIQVDSPIEAPPLINVAPKQWLTALLVVGFLASLFVMILVSQSTAATPQSRPEILTPTTGRHSWPSFEPGGDQFVSTRHFPDRKVIVLGRSGDVSERQLAPSARNQDFASWSPNGKKIAYLEFSNTTDPDYPAVSLFLIAADSSRPDKIAQFPLHSDACPASTTSPCREV